MGRLGTISATAMVPGVSSNRRLYTREAISRAAQRMSSQIGSGGLPILMRSHHGAGDDSTKIVGAWRSVSVDPDTGAMHVAGDLADTQAGRDIAALTTPDSQGRRFLDSVSIYGYWIGDPKTVEHGGQQVETCDDLEVVAVDFTGSPGVPGARIDQVRLGESRTAPLIAESTEMNVTADQPLDYDKGGTLPAEAKDALTSAPSGSYADPGYQADGKKRYPLDTKAHVRAAWAFINRGSNAKPYTSKQLARIKARIKQAAKRLGVSISGETAAQDYATLAETVMPRLAEAYASMSLDNGPASVGVSGYSIDPADLPAAGAVLTRAALAALACLDPDNDGDIDLPGADDTGGDGDDDADGTCPTCGSDLPVGAYFCPMCGQPITSSETAGNNKENDVTDTTTPEEASATAPETVEQTGTVEETAPAADTTEQAQPDVQALAEALAAALATKTTPVTETTSATDALSEATTSPDLSETVKAAVAEGLQAAKDELREEIIAAYGPRRRGLVRTAETDGGKPLHEMSEEEFRAYRTDVLNAYVPGATPSA